MKLQNFYTRAGSAPYGGVSLAIGMLTSGDLLETVLPANQAIVKVPTLVSNLCI